MLPELVRAVHDAQLPVLWCCDPMHGNTRLAPCGLKTRDVSAVEAELRRTFAVHRRLGGWLGGVHLELTGDDVTECVGNAAGDVREEDVPARYTTYCDPRLNLAQSLQVARVIAGQFEVRSTRGLLLKAC